MNSTDSGFSRIELCREGGEFVAGEIFQQSGDCHLQYRVHGFGGDFGQRL